MYPALKAPGLAAGMAASALNLNGLGVMNRSVVFLESFISGNTYFKYIWFDAAKKLLDWTAFLIHYRAISKAMLMIYIKMLSNHLLGCIKYPSVTKQFLVSFLAPF